jgi:hypothetical protein
MIEGCLEWQRMGLTPPAAVTKATTEYLEAQDALSAWIDERCARDPRAETNRTFCLLTGLSGQATPGTPRLSTSGSKKRASSRAEPIICASSSAYA